MCCPNLKYILALPEFFVAIFANFANKNNSSADSIMPMFDNKFPPKTLHVNDSVELTFSSMEEAEWKLLNANLVCEGLMKILSSIPESMDYPFDSIFHKENNISDLCSPVKSDDGNVRCFGRFPHAAHQVPHMIIQYRINDEVRVAEEQFPSENCYYCLDPDTVFIFNTGKSTIYLVWGYGGYTGSGDEYKLCAYELDDTGLHPAFVFEEDFFGRGQSLYTEICNNDEMYAELDFKSLAYFDKDKSTIYIRAIVDKEIDECGCTTKMTNRYWKFKWNGKKFVQKD